MKIKGWEKINGYTYKGYTIVNPIHNVGETKYEATILDLNLPQKPKWELSVLMPDFKFKQDCDITIILWDENKYRATKSVSKNMVSTLAGFRILFEDLVDEVLKLRLISAARITANSHSLSTGYSKPINTNLYGTATIAGNTGGGILTTINANSNTITYDPKINLPNSMLVAIKDLQKQIDDLKNNNANNK